MPMAAIALIVTACACFTSIDVTVKHLSQRYPVPLLVWARWGVQALLMFALLAPTMRWNLVRTARPVLHLVRGTVLIASSLCFFSAVKYLPLAEATALNYTSPILVTLLAGWLLRRAHHLAAVGLRGRGLRRHAADRASRERAFSTPLPCSRLPLRQLMRFTRS